ncbi:unnamed protein product, partial [marine sediment metagenome]
MKPTLVKTLDSFISQKLNSISFSDIRRFFDLLSS